MSWTKTAIPYTYLIAGPFDEGPSQREISDYTERFHGLRSDRDWKGLLALQPRLAGHVSVLRLMLSSQSALIAVAASALKSQDVATEQYIEALASATDPESIATRDAVRKHLLAEYSDTGVFDRYFAALPADRREAPDARRQVVDSIVRDSVSIIDQCTSIESMCAEIAFEAPLGSTREALGYLELRAATPYDVRVVRNAASELRNKCELGMRDLYSALYEGVDIDDFAVRATACRETFMHFLPVAGVMLGALLEATAVAPVSEREGVLPIALDLCEHARRTRVAHSYAAYCSNHLLGANRARWYGHERRRAQRRDYASAVPTGDLSPPGGSGGVDPDPEALVQLSGTVSGIGYLDDPRPPKFSTYFDLLRPSGHRPIRIRAHMFSLPNNGVRDSAYVRLQCRLSDSRTINDDVPTYDIDRVSLTQLRRKSWMDDVTYRMRDYVSLYPDEMNMFFTPAVDPA